MQDIQIFAAAQHDIHFQTVEVAHIPNGFVYVINNLGQEVSNRSLSPV